MDEKIKQLVEKLETYGFMCQAGNLEQCGHWQELKKLLLEPK